MLVLRHPLPDCTHEIVVDDREWEEIKLRYIAQSELTMLYVSPKTPMHAVCQ